MAWLWPWKGDASSTASFEKTLSTLATKIASTQADLDRLRGQSRRAKVVAILYLSFAYVVFAIVAALVIGYRNLGPYEWSGVVGGPPLIYATRSILSAFYNFRIDRVESRLKGFQEERAKTIQKLKDATKYDSTLELIQKYGGGDAKGAKKKDGDGESRGSEGPAKNSTAVGGGPGRATGGTPGRTNLPPPPTANIQRGPRGPGPVSGPGTPAQHDQHQRHAASPGSMAAGATPGQGNAMSASEEFAPNAFGAAPTAADTRQYGQHEGLVGSSHWYDRVLDLLMGEDETAAKNRIVLVCKHCRLVNGQAPPGTKSLSEMGTWKCMACGATNGEMDEGKKIVREVLAAREKEAELATSRTWPGSEDDSSDLVEVENTVPSYSDRDNDDGGALRRRKPRTKAKK